MIIEAEVEDVIKNLKKNKAPGPVQIINEFLKDYRSTLIRPLTKIFNMILETEEIPIQWKISEIILLFKKGSKKEIENYRPISLSSNIYKIFMKIVKNRIYNQLDLNQGIEQAGFRRNQSTIDHLQAINQVIETALEYQMETHMLFIDFHKAFDSVEHEYLWKGLKKQGIPLKLINILRSTYENSKAYIKLEKEGETFEIGRGVKQGDPLSPNLFNSIIEELVKSLQWENEGIKINGRFLNNLRFADDIILLSSNKESLEKMGEELMSESEKGGLEMNKKKTKYMSYRKTGSQEKFKINGTEIEEVSEYDYLGQTVAFRDRMDKELKKRTSKAWGKFWSLNKVFKNRKLGLKLKIKMLESCVLPVLSYGSQTWSLTKEQTVKLQKTQRAMERRILGIKLRDKVSKRNIRETTQSRDIGVTIKN